ncbi:Uncharacterised protein [Clostridium putrefaciens]|uniref:Uncharacterized protein n=1 Tax=Clostridium putrefaciens TaxID=99675 RepID=A0A381J9I8_9CLOT|nr:hypothetical protein [Clostridium putrefaciens]SUY47116.1 Uncharacterised protein [Clostridium putrefaciens]SUY47128.1 Uncharacterised protein [Clostridium putrefaciens]
MLETLDEKLLKERDIKVYRNKGLKKTCLRTIIWDVEYSRRIYQFELENGAKWIKASCEDQDIHFELAPFHISQAFIRKVSDKKEQKVLLKLFRQGKVDEGLEVIVNMMIENNKDEVVFKKLTELYDYFVHNKEG